MGLFWNEHKGYVLLYFINFTLLLLFFNYLEDLSKPEIIGYFIFLSCTTLFVFLIFRYYRSYKLYQLLKQPVKNYFFEDLGSTAVCKATNKMLKFYQRENLKLENKYKQERLQYRLFVDQWIHSLKTPLSVLQLICQDNDEHDAIIHVQAETDKLLYGVNLALYYARSNEVGNDLRIETIGLNNTVKEVVHELKRWFIRWAVIPIVNISPDYELQTDVKWFKFIVYQLLTNAIKYSDKSNSSITISLSNHCLTISDEGMGIPAKDLGRIFDLFFTGENGRKKGESTGIGLHLTQLICEKLNYQISINSSEQKGTQAMVTFN